MSRDDSIDLREDADGRGHEADSPTEVPAPGWLEVAKRVKARIKEENAVLLAAGVAFFGMFAVFPALVAVISLYGLVADPSDVQSQVESLAGAMPASTRSFLQEQLVKERGVALLIVDQFAQRALEMADTVYVMRRGTIAASGSADQMRDDDIFSHYLGAD